jgi:hypothetical protein
LITLSGAVDEHALRWHVFVWDLWFLVWGLGLGIAAWRCCRSGTAPEAGHVKIKMLETCLYMPPGQSFTTG